MSNPDRIAALRSSGRELGVAAETAKKITQGRSKKPPYGFPAAITDAESGPTHSLMTTEGDQRVVERSAFPQHPKLLSLDNNYEQIGSCPPLGRVDCPSD